MKTCFMLDLKKKLVYRCLSIKEDQMALFSFQREIQANQCLLLFHHISTTYFRCMDTPYGFCHFDKGNNFVTSCLHHWTMKLFQKWAYS